MIAIDSDRQAFLRTIAEHPDDDTPRLVFSDWLEERGETREAERIRYGVANPDLTKLERIHIIPTSIIDQNLPPSHTLLELDFVRGFAKHARCICKTWLDHGHWILAENPLISRVSLTDKSPFLAWVDYNVWFLERDLPDTQSRLNFLPAKLFNFIEPVGYSSHFLPYKEALDALSAACLKYARREKRDER